MVLRPEFRVRGAGFRHTDPEFDHAVACALATESLRRACPAPWAPPAGLPQLPWTPVRRERLIRRWDRMGWPVPKRQAAWGDFVQDDTKETASGTGDTLAFGTNTTAGNSIIAVVRIGDVAATTPTVTDSQSNNYTRDKVQTRSSVGSLSIHRASNIVGGACTLTVSTGVAATTIKWLIIEYSGQLAVDVAAVSAAGNDAAPTPGNIVTSTAATLLVTAIAVNDAGTEDAPTNFTERTQVSSYMSAADRKVASATTYAAVWALGGSNPWCAILAAYKDGAGGGGSVARRLVENPPINSHINKGMVSC
ncbi:MAG: hypothetical protein AB7I13_00310 [Vicinamibacterales bacterium]